MFKFVCLFALVSAAFAASIRDLESTTEKREIIPLLSFERESSPDGSFSFSFEGADHSFREESAQVVDAGTEDEALEISGSYRYIDADGNPVEVHYTAGKNGFVPVGTNIPSEISDAARAAADLPHHTEDELKRKSRSNDEKVNTDIEPLAEESKVEEQKVENAEELKAEESKVEDAVVSATEVYDEAKTETA